MASSLEDLSQDCPQRFIMYLFIGKAMLTQISSRKVYFDLQWDHVLKVELAMASSLEDLSQDRP